jgi:hypothetical protein
MADRIPCTACGALILPTTAESTGGLCMPCKQGTRQQIEQSKRYYDQQKQYDPFRELWKSLVHRVYDAADGYEGLTSDERLYFAVGVLDGDVYNGGMYQFFSNSSGSLYRDAVEGLRRLEAQQALGLLLQAKQILFGDAEPPPDCQARWDAMKQYPTEAGIELPVWRGQLEAVDNAYWKDPDSLGERLAAFAETKSLVEPFKIRDVAGDSTEPAARSDTDETPLSPAR